MNKMIRLNTIVLFVIGLFSGLNVNAQDKSTDIIQFNSEYVKMDRNSDNIYFKAGVLKAEDISSKKGNLSFQQKELVENGVIRIVQFKTLPDNALKAELLSKGIKLLNYVPNRAFIAHIPKDIQYESLQSWGVSGLSNYVASAKLDKFITTGQYPDYDKNGDKRRLIVTFYDVVDFATSISKIDAGTYELVSEKPEFNGIEILIEIQNINALAENPYVKYIEIGHDIGQPENATARTLHRSNTLNTNYLGGKKYDGTGVVVMMQDDGDIGPHIDFQGRVDQSSANVTGSSGNHGDHVAGTFMGAGNLDPLAEGMAPGVFGFIHGNLNSNYNSVPNRISNDGLVLTTKSYSDGCNQGYTSLTQQLDQQVNTYTNLMHVFSAGNSGTSNCGYGAGSFWGNVTGGHKVGKNVITVASLNFIDQITSSSSRGPAADGRLKPDIASKGVSVYSNDENYSYRTISGTSMACPGVTGTLAQLYHAYRDLNGGQDPNSSLIKATVLNSAEDLGNPGPDYIYGWGRINASRAYTILENQQYLDSTIANGGANTHTLNIPSGVAQVKIMLYWNDPASFQGASFNLVNDLTLQVNDPATTLHSPLVLDPTPSPAILNSPAVPGIDNLNNMEQVVIDNPISGNYQISVQGTMVPTGPQEYFIVYQYQYNDVVDLTYPLGGEPFAPGETQTIRWDAFGNTGSFLLEYSLDSGLTWSNISASVSGSQRYFNWSVPSSAGSDIALIRITRGIESDISDATFTILGVPQNINVNSNCTDSAQLNWSAVANADAYIVRKLGAEYMDSVGFTTGTSLFVTDVNVNDPDIWLTVQAVRMNANGTKITGYGRRAYATRKPTGLFNCPSEAPLAAYSVDTVSICVGKTVKFSNETVNGSNSYTWTITPSSHSFVNGTNANSFEPEIQFLTDNQYTVKLEAFNPGGSSSEEKVNIINPFFPDNILEQYFNGPLSLPEGWVIESSNGPQTWSFIQVSAGSNGFSTRAAYFNRFADNRLSQEDGLISTPVDISSYSNPILTFDIANTYQQATPTTLAGGLRVDISEDCGLSFTPSGYLKRGDDLITRPYSTTLFLPNSQNDWRQDTVALSNFIGGQVLIKFVNLSGVFGNTLVIDNVKVVENTTVGIARESSIDFKLFPNPTNGVLEIKSSNVEKGVYTILVCDNAGRIVNSITTSENNSNLHAELNFDGLSSGLYTVKIIGENNISVHKISYTSNK